MIMWSEYITYLTEHHYYNNILMQTNVVNGYIHTYNYAYINSMSSLEYNYKLHYISMEYPPMHRFKCALRCLDFNNN